MKMIPKVELMVIIGSLEREIISEDHIKQIFHVLGDDYYKLDNMDSKWELCNINLERKGLFKNETSMPDTQASIGQM